MPSKSKPAIITPYSEPRQVFQASPANLKGHQDLIDDDAFEASSSAVISQFATDLAKGVKDMSTAASAGFRLQGAVEFLQSFKQFAEIQVPEPTQETYGELQNTDQPRRV